MKKNILVIITLSLLAALEPLSIDIYLPAFVDISQQFGVELSQVQISLSTFLAGFAVGQLLWGPLSDYYGRKKPIVIAMLIFVICSFMATVITNMESLWVVRFFQAFSGCAGVVIGRAMVNDIFEGKLRTKVFSLLIVMSGIAPILAPSLGNVILKVWHWQGSFHAMGIIGIVTIAMSLLFLPQNKSVKDLNLINAPRPTIRNVFIGYVRVMGNWQFVIYTLIGALLYASLLTYISNAPFIIMTVGGLSSDYFAIIFTINAIGLMIGTALITPLNRRISLTKLVFVCVVLQFPISVLLIAFSVHLFSIIPLLILLFMNLILVGILMPATTSLALETFVKESGTASALMGFIQLFFTFLFSATVSYLQNNSILPAMMAIFACVVLSLLTLWIQNNKKIHTLYFRIGKNISRTSFFQR